MEAIRTTKSNNISTLIGYKGSGKTALSEMLILLNNKPAIIADPRLQYPTMLKRRLFFTSPKKLTLWIKNIDNFKDFYNYKLELVCKVDDENIEILSKTVYELHRITYCVDEVDMFFPTSATAKNYIYKLVNYGRHNEIDLITTSRRPANINRSLTANTDDFYFAKISEPTDLQYFKNIAGEKYLNEIQLLSRFEFLKYSEGGNLCKVKTSKSNLELIDGL
ncbi:MAG: hypothetical protein LBT96_05440 [Campylobacteraceae bacterium]|nr:hypothetical protein [Campylobacteraceae bacterium]